MSQIKVNSIVPLGGLPSGANGGIIQVVTAHKSDASSTTSTSFVDSGLEATITPQSNSSKILIIADAKVGMASGNIGYVGLFRGSTQICLGDTNGSAIRSYGAMDGTSHSHNAYPANCVFLDSPSTTSSTTYKIRYRGNNGNTVRLNRAGSDRSNGTDGVFASNITLFEIST
tara:strand:+ start:512 stop:1027 length:516 start_codon:yes stop_codon:yes gene_type:complete